MSALRDLTVWLPALEAQLRNAPPGVELVEYTGTVGQGSVGGSHRMDGNSPNRGLSGHDWSEELFALAKQYDIDCVGVVLRSSRSGIREVDLIELPGCVTSLPGGDIVGTLVLHDGALPALYRRRPDPTVAAAGPAHSADPAALARLVAQKVPDATPATPEQLAEVDLSTRLIVSSQANTRIKQDIQHVGNQHAEDEQDRGDDHRPHHQRIVALKHSVDHQPP